MKLKLTLRFLLCNIIIFYVGWSIFIVMNVILMNSNISFGENFFNVTFNASNFVDETKKDIRFIDDKFLINDKREKVLKENNIWLQVLDEGNTEVYNVNKPKEIQTHYRTGELIKNRTSPWESKHPVTLMFREIEEGGKFYTLVIALPINKFFTYTLGFTEENFKFFLISFCGFALGLTLIVGVWFSRSLASPINDIVNNIELLKEGKVVNKKFKNNLYEKVNENIMNLSITLHKNELDRAKIDKAKEEWIANIAHDLKTPLSSIKGYGELLSQDDYEITVEDAKRYGNVIKEKSKYMQELIEDLSLIYKLKNKVLPFKLKEKNLINIVREVVIDILNNPNFSNREINIHYNYGNIMFRCDEKYLKRAFNNFIINALIHNNDNTIVNISVNKINNGINVGIEDNGQGINEEEINNIFNRYYKGSHTGEKAKGTGLGMAISKEIIHGHGGTVKVESLVGVGTSVMVRF
ncbi:sensor histidine kinase [Clostridium tarantellae]|uniref:histidine kinase n=1 Tax=Clostridium tarantellae TaxID=39493 RepID=A0A6I1MIJ8_9CLOT|nr:HAMP domain-containing sensor histidine kinase [Clostridium tarantellae]MPQ42950.1 sensor histidine kinase [Clostridium tarantellae]